MTEAIKLICPPNGRYHFGMTSPDSDTALSQTSACFYNDTLFSALVNLCNKIFPSAQVEELVAAFRSGKVVISSGSFCVDIFKNGEKTPEKTIFFLPKPPHFDLQSPSILDRKKVKGIQYISKTIWEKGLNPKDWWDQNQEKCYIIDRTFLLHPEDLDFSLGKLIDSFYQMKTAPKIADHARKKENNIFTQTDVFIHPTLLTLKDFAAQRIEGLSELLIQPHFYFLLKFDQAADSLRDLVYLLLNMLPDEGFGGGISTGCGKIEGVEIQPWEMNFQSHAASEDQAISMAMIALSEKEVGQVKAGEIMVRGGRATALHGALKRVKMIKPGALITGSLKGQIVSLNDDAPYLRNGKAFPLPMPTTYELS